MLAYLLLVQLSDPVDWGALQSSVLAGGGDLTTSSGGGDFRLLLRVHALLLLSLSPWAWGVVAYAPVGIVDPMCILAGPPTDKPILAPCVFVSIGSPIATPPANA
jgi:hypothetical protein